MATLRRPLSRLQGLAHRRAGRCASGCSPTATPSAPTADVAVVNTCCVTHEALSQVAPGGGARRAHAPARLRHRLRARTSTATRSPACRRTSSSSRAAARRRRPPSPATSARSAACSADARLDRVRAFVKIQDGCSFSCNFCVIPLVRGGTRSRARRRRAREIRRRVAQGHREVVLTGHQPRLLPRPRGRLHARAPRARGRRDARARTAAPLVDRDQPRRPTSSSPRCARRRRSRGTCTCRSSPATTACCARWGAATPSRRTCAGSSRSTTSTSRPT